MLFKYAVALTGGISTGKSTVSELFRDKGVEIIDADRVAHQVLREQSSSIAELFGKEYVIDGEVDRKALGGLVFASHEAKKQLEELLHPLIYKEIKTQSKKLDEKSKHYLVDIPLFFETSRYPIKESIVVYTPKAIQLERLMKRNGFSKEEALQRINAQMDIDQKRYLSTYLIDNSGDLNALQSECDRIHQMIFRT